MVNTASTVTTATNTNMSHLVVNTATTATTTTTTNTSHQVVNTRIGRRNWHMSGLMQQFFPFPTNQPPNNCDFDLLNLEALIVNEAQLQFLSVDLSELNFCGDGLFF